MSTGSGASRAWKTMLPPAVIPNWAWPTPTIGIGFLPGPPSRMRCLMPSSAKNPLASATMIGANSPFRSQPSWVLTSTAWPEAGAAPPRSTPRTRARSSRERESAIAMVSLVAREAGERGEQRGAARLRAVTGTGVRPRGGGDRRDDDPRHRRTASPVDRVEVGDLEVAQPLGRIDHDRQDREAHAVHAGEPELRSGRLADDVEAEAAVGAVLGRGLEPRPGGVDVDAAGLEAGRPGRPARARDAGIVVEVGRDRGGPGGAGARAGAG